MSGEDIALFYFVAALVVGFVLLIAMPHDNPDDDVPNALLGAVGGALWPLTLALAIAAVVFNYTRKPANLTEER